MHAYLITNGQDYAVESRQGNWDQVPKYKQTEEVVFDYVERGGPDNLGINVNAEAALPEAYMLWQKDDRLSVHSGDFDRPEWVDYIYEDTLVDAQTMGSIEYLDEYDRNPAGVLSENGIAKKGGYIKVEIPDSDNREIQLLITGGLGTYKGKYGMEVNFKGVEKPVALDPETGEINTDFMNFIGYAPPKSESRNFGIDPDNYADDTGFERFDEGSLGIFAEGISRVMFRNSIASETMPYYDLNRRYISTAYSAANGQETAAKFAEVLFDGGLSQVYSQEEIENLYEHHEDLIWAANQHFDIPAYIRNELSVAVERDWEDIIEDLNRRYGEL
jgi:hypothetical protein